MSGEWRYVLTRMNGDGTESPLHWDAPLVEVNVSRTLSAATLVTARVAARHLIEAGDGLEMFLQWSTALWVEESGTVHAGGLLVDLILTEDSSIAELTFLGLSGYPSGMPHTGNYAVIEKDALQVYRDLWEHVSSHSSGDLGVQVVGDSRSGVLLGEPAKPGYTEAKLDDEWQDARKTGVKRRVIPDTEATLSNDISTTSTSIGIKDFSLTEWREHSIPFIASIGAEDVRVDRVESTYIHVSARGVGETKATKHYDGTTVRAKGTPTREVSPKKAEPWTASWWATSDLGRVMDGLADNTPFEFREEHDWQGDVLSHRIRIGCPKIGVRRHSPRFVVGENVTVEPDIEWDGDEFASEVLILGAGEGAKMVRASSARVSGRLRRAVVLSDKSATQLPRAQALARSELERRVGNPNITELKVVDHPNAPRGSYDVGDEIFVVTNSNIGMWVRVLEINFSPDDTSVQVTVERADRT